MSRPPPGRSSVASGLAPPANVLQPMRGSSIFAPAPGAQLGPPPGYNVSPGQMPLSRPQSRMEPPPLSNTIGPMPGSLQRPLDPRKKRIIVCCDGTWMDADNGIMNGRKQEPSNVSRIGWALKATSRDGFSQVVHYQAGVGSQGGRVSRILGGAVGLGLKSNISEAYNYLAVNYHEGDEIFLMGFSRGAFTARNVGGMIGDLGLLTKAGLPSFNEIFEDYMHRNNPNYVSDFPNIPFPGKGPFDKRYVARLEHDELTRLRIPIKVIACWDTVGSLGIPRIPVLESLRIQPREMSNYQFYDTRLNPYVENAFQALALDERRGPFSPSLWEKSPNDTVNLKQVWFPGVHSNIGGGYDDEELSNITLAWMISRLEPFLDFRDHYIASIFKDNQNYYEEEGQKARWWSFGELYNSFKGLYTFIGAATRTPGNYHRVDPHTGRTEEKKLRNTNEYIHASVRSRIGLHGPGLSDRGEYNPLALKDWSFNVINSPNQPGNVNGQMVMWTNHAAEETGGQPTMPEAMLLPTEHALLGLSPRVTEYVRSMREPAKDRRRRKGPDDPALMAGAMPPSGMEGPQMNGSPRSHRRERRARSLDPAEDRHRKRRSRKYEDK